MNSNFLYFFPNIIKMILFYLYVYKHNKLFQFHTLAVILLPTVFICEWIGIPIDVL